MKFERWDPTKEFYDLTNFVRDIFDEKVANPIKKEWERTWKFPVDVYETNNEIFLEAELPGVDKDDIEITLENGYLTIAAKNFDETEDSCHKENKKEAESETKEPGIDRERNYFYKERKCGVFSRTFEVGEGIDQDEIKADYSNGILTLKFKRPEIKKNEVKKIKID
ncbi:MAG: Hsp20/alpha crystallin family protein [Candidatus Muiribacteriota bacterium]